MEMDIVCLYRLVHQNLVTPNYLELECFSICGYYIEVDENGNEFKRPWTLQEFLIEHFFIVIGVIIGAIFF